MRFDGSRGAKVITYASWWIRKRILLALEEQGRVVRVPARAWRSREREPEPPRLPIEVSLDADLPDECPSHPVQRLANQEDVAFLGRALHELSPSERTVLAQRFGLAGEAEHTLRETGKRLGMSGERVRQIELVALERLRRLFRNRAALAAAPARPPASVRQVGEDVRRHRLVRGVVE